MISISTGKLRGKKLFLTNEKCVYFATAQTDKSSKIKLEKQIVEKKS